MSTITTFVRSVLRGDATRDQARDTGMALVLILLLFAVFQERIGFVLAAIGVHVLNMTAPQIFRPAAVVWFGLSHLLGTVVSKVLLAVVFFVVVTPVGRLRRLMGADSLQLQAFKAGSSSVMKVRNHLFTGKDLEQPY
jgi:hypothetical protein